MLDWFRARIRTWARAPRDRALENALESIRAGRYLVLVWGEQGPLAWGFVVGWQKEDHVMLANRLDGVGCLVVPWDDITGLTI